VQLLEWLDRLAKGETSLQRLRQECAANPSDMRLRLSLARKLRESDADEATREFVWLWRNMLTHQPSMIGVKHSFMLGDLSQLVTAHAAARDAFVKLRDEDAPVPGQPLDGEKLGDWVSLNKVLRDGAAILTWFDATPREQLLVADKEVRHVLENDVVELLISRDRWADAGALVIDPLQKVAHRVELLRHEGGGDAAMKAEYRKFATKHFRSEMAQLVRALVSAGRSDDVERVRAAALAQDPSQAMIKALDKAVEQAAVVKGS
jgi:hypothetical protein